MNDFPKPSAPAGIPGPVVEVDLPRGMFFEARDYAPGASSKAAPSQDQIKVSKARARSMVELRQLIEKFGVALGHLRVADDYGLVTPSMDVLVGVADEIHDTVLRLAKLADNAEARYEEYFEAPAAELPSPAAAAVGIAAVQARYGSAAVVSGGVATSTVYNPDNGPNQIAGYINGLAVPASPLLTAEATARIRAARATQGRRA